MTQQDSLSKNNQENHFFKQNESITLDQLKNFITVFELGSLSKAASVTRKTQPAISHSLNKLEEKLNVQLMVRNRGKSISVTEEGHRFYREISPLINKLLVRIDETESKNAITIGVPEDLPMDVQLALQREISTITDGRLRFICGFSSHIQKMVTEGRISFGIVKQASKNGNLKYGWAYNREVEIDTFNKVPLVSGYSGCLIRDLVEVTLEKRNQDYYFVYLSNRIIHRVEAVKAGFGVGVFFKSRIAEDPLLIELDEKYGFPKLNGFNYKVVGEGDTVQKRAILPIINDCVEMLNRA